MGLRLLQLHRGQPRVGGPHPRQSLVVRVVPGLGLLDASSHHHSLVIPHCSNARSGNDMCLKLKKLRVLKNSPLHQSHAINGLVVGSNAAHAKSSHPKAQSTLIEIEALVRVDRIEYLQLS